MDNALRIKLPSIKIERPDVDWTLDHEEKDLRTRFTISSERGERHVICPIHQASGIQDILLGYEYPIPLPIRELIHGMPVVDIGAHVGSANVYFDEVLRPSKIVSFEPNPSSLEYLKANCNGSTTIIHAAVANHTQGAVLNTPPVNLTITNGGVVQSCDDYPNLFCSTIYRAPEELGTVEHIKVPTVCGFDALQMVKGDIGLLKIDAEGSELTILLDAEKELSRVWTVYLEYHSEILRRQCDALLSNYVTFFAEGHLRQGVVGYLRKDIAEKFPDRLYF